MNRIFRYSIPKFTGSITNNTALLLGKISDKIFIVTKDDTIYKDYRHKIISQFSSNLSLQSLSIKILKALKNKIKFNTFLNQRKISDIKMFKFVTILSLVALASANPGLNHVKALKSLLIYSLIFFYS